MKKTTKSTVSAIAVLSMAEIQKLTPGECAVRFAEKAGVSQRAFAEMGKLYVAISARLKPKESIYKVLRSHGVKDSTVSNASYAAKAWALVVSKHIMEEQYNALTFTDCYAMSRAMSDDSVNPLIPADVALVLQESKDPARDFESVFETGVTADEAEARAKEQEKRRVQAEKEREERLKADEAARVAAAKSAPSVAPATASVPTAAAPDVAPPVTVSAPPKAAMPPAPRKATAQDALNLIDALEVMLIEIDSEEELKPVVKKLVELTTFATEHVADNKDPHGTAGKKAPANTGKRQLAAA